MGWNWHKTYLWMLPNKIRPYLGQTLTSMPSGIVDVQNHSLGGHFPKSASALWQVRINNCIFFSQFSLIAIIMPRQTPIIRYYAWSACTRPWGHTLKSCWWSRGSDSCYREPLPLKACCHWNFGARQVNGGSSEDHTSSKPCVIEDGRQDCFIRARGLDGADEEFVWNEGWPGNHQQLALVPGLPCL